MKKLKGALITAAVILVISATTLAAFAASQYSTPAEAVAGLTGRSPDSVREERISTGRTYGTIAAEAGKLDEFKAEVLEIKKTNLAEQVADGKISRADADKIIDKLEENQANCDGTGGAQLGYSMGAKFGSHGEGFADCGLNRGGGLGRGRGNGHGAGKGQDGRPGKGAGGLRLRDGSCRQ